MWTVLVIDDDPEDREVLAEALRHDARFRLVAACPDAGSGLAATAKHLPDVVLCDVFLGDGPDGFDVVDRLARQDVPVVLMSADATLRNLARLTQAAAYVHKGQDRAEILATLAGAGRRSRATARPALVAAA